jgi:hypothetical protein
MLNDELHIVSLVCTNVKEEAGLTIREIARKMGYKTSHVEVQRILDMGPRSSITLKTLFKFAEACGYVCNISFKKKKEGRCPTP